MPENARPDDNLDNAILKTVAYADIFDYPMRADEILRYLVGCRATLDEVRISLDKRLVVDGGLGCREGFYTMPGRGMLVDLRRRRAEVARALWPIAIRYGHLMARLPFARMVAVTGSLSVDNTEPGADVDFLVVTANNRLWLCRAMVILLVRLAARRDIHLCPNYFLAERALVLDERTLYVARELAQMVPLSGAEVYWQLRRSNEWLESFLPNAQGLPNQNAHLARPLPAILKLARSLAEAALRTPFGASIERWEMNRKVRKFRKLSPDKESAFSADYCKGHFESHGQRAMALFEGKLGGLKKK